MDKAIAWPVALKEQLVAIHEIDWMIRRANDGVCNRQRGGSGLLLDALSSYPQSSREFVAQTTGLGALPQVISVVTGSPAAEAGLMQGDVILGIGTLDLSQALQPSSAEPQLVVTAQEAVDSPAPGSSVSIRVRRSEREQVISFVPDSLCAGYSTLRIDKGREAYSDRQNLVVTSGMVEFVARKDELAFVIAHELAHTIFQDSGKNGLGRRSKERRADLFATYAIRCAGYDPGAGPQLMRRMKENDWQAWLRSPSHPSYEKRSVAMEALPGDLPCQQSSVLEVLTQKARS